MGPTCVRYKHAVENIGKARLSKLQIFSDDVAFLEGEKELE